MNMRKFGHLMVFLDCQGVSFKLSIIFHNNKRRYLVRHLFKIQENVEKNRWSEITGIPFTGTEFLAKRYLKEYNGIGNLENRANFRVPILIKLKNDNIHKFPRILYKAHVNNIT